MSGKLGGRTDEIARMSGKSGGRTDDIARMSGKLREGQTRLQG